MQASSITENKIKLKYQRYRRVSVCVVSGVRVSSQINQSKNARCHLLLLMIHL